MDLSEQPQNDNIKKTEDIIDMQRVNGSLRQVAFSLPSEAESTSSGADAGARNVGGGVGGVSAGACAGAGTGLARSLESGLARPARARALSLKKPKKLRHKRRKSPLPDVISWPSDSDITVLRMKLCLAGAGAGAGGAAALTDGTRLQTAGDVMPGDGLHHPDDSSMVNLATLVLHSRSPSKRSLNIEEYLLPLSSWERAPPPPAPGSLREARSLLPTERKVFGATCSHSYYHEKLSSKEHQASGLPKASAKSKVARFLRLYFCPCCTCLYEMETMRPEPSERECEARARCPALASVAAP